MLGRAGWGEGRYRRSDDSILKMWPERLHGQDCTRWLTESPIAAWTWARSGIRSSQDSPPPVSRTGRPLEGFRVCFRQRSIGQALSVCGSDCEGLGTLHGTRLVGAVKPCLAGSQRDRAAAYRGDVSAPCRKGLRGVPWRQDESHSEGIGRVPAGRRCVKDGRCWNPFAGGFHRARIGLFSPPPPCLHSSPSAKPRP